MKPFLRWCFVATALTLAGCSNSAWRKDAVLAVPLQPTLQQEVILARMEQILASRALTDDERAQLLYERGVLYHSRQRGGLVRRAGAQPDKGQSQNHGRAGTEAKDKRPQHRLSG